MRRSTLVCLFSFGISVGVLACSSSGSQPESGGGGNGSGGSTSSGGASSGGMTGSGGASSGGSSASGGSAASGGGGGRAGSGGTGGQAAGGAAGGKSSGGSGGGQSGGAAGTTATGGAGGSGGGGYNPCKASPCVIFPLGDSITHGYSSTDDAGYRSALFKLTVAANQNVTFVGSLTNGPTTVSGKTFPSHHEGHDGFTVTQITGLVPPAKSLPTTTPHIVLVHAGTNDMTMNADPTTTANQLSTLITDLVNAAPDALIVVAKIVPLGYSNTNYTSYIAKIPGVVQAHASDHVIMVDM